MTTAAETLTRVARIADLSDGDAIVLKKGDNVVRGTVRTAAGARRIDLGSGSAGPTVGNFTDAGYAIHRVGPSLPTERGVYVAGTRGTSESIEHLRLFRLTSAGWSEVNGAFERITPERMASLSRIFGGLTRLVVEPEKPAGLSVVIDKDSDKWTLAADGTWVMNDNDPEEGGGETLDYVRREYGPLKTLDGAPA